MRAVTGEITSSKRISLSKAARVLSRFVASETGAPPDVAAYLRNAATAFNELVTVHRDIGVHPKISHAEEKDAGTQEYDISRLKIDRKSNSILETQGGGGGGINKKVKDLGFLLQEKLANAMVESNGVAVVKKKKEKEKDEKSGVGTLIESNGVVEKRMNEKMAKKKDVKDESKVEMKILEVEDYGKRSEVLRNKKENKRKEGRLHEVDRVGLISENMDSDRKKRKHSDAEQGVDVEMEQHKGKKKNKRRAFEQ